MATNELEWSIFRWERTAYYRYKDICTHLFSLHCRVWCYHPRFPNFIQQYCRFKFLRQSRAARGARSRTI
jgi:hypothetical protein